jgi:hypothetical protein
MHSVRTSVAVLATALFSLSVRSQAVYYVDPNSVPLSTRTAWCTSQTQECPLLCLQLPGASSTTASNDCDPTTLTYDCICGNGLSPNASEYSQTLPYFICTEYGNQCVAACNSNTACQSACRDDHPCGAQNPTQVNTTAASTMSATATGTGTNTAAVAYNGIGSTATAASSSKKNSGNAALDLGATYGLGVVFLGLFTGFALVM